MANVSAIKLPNGTTYNIKDTISGYTTNTGTVTSVAVSAGTGISVSGSPVTSSGTITVTNSGVTGVKGSAESSYRTGQVNLTPANIGAIPSNSSGNTLNLLRPLQLNGLADVTLDAKINTLRANRLAFLPADQIIIEKTTDGGSTWTDAGIADSTKVGLFSETRAEVYIPLLNGVKNINCGLRITITGMKYNVPSGTAETSKYNYWNSNYIVSTERYNQLKEMYFWVSANSDTISVKVERATGAASTTWNTIFDNSNYGLTGWSGNDYIRFAQGVFGGGTGRPDNYWNYRLTFFTRGPGGSTTLSGTNTTSAQSIMEIRGYGDTWWSAGNEYAANDHLYKHDYLKNATFPAKVTATSFSGPLTGNVTGTATTAANVSSTGAATTNVNRHVWFSDSGTETKRTHDDDFMYNPSTNVLTVGSITGSAAKVNNHTVATDVPANAVFTDTNYYHTTGSWSGLTYTATANGGAGALAFTIPTGTAATNVAVGNHTHTLTLASDSGTSAITLASATKYKLTAGGNSVIFTMPTINTGTITSIKTTSGTHTTINVSSGAANFNVPTKTSHLTNDSNFVVGPIEAITTEELDTVLVGGTINRAAGVEF